MIKITVENDQTKIELQGRQDNIFIDTCFALEAVLMTLKQELHCSDRVIKAAFNICMTHDGDLIEEFAGK